MDLGKVDYLKAYAIQQQIVSARLDQTIEHEVLLIQEHPAVFTLGKNGGRENLTVTEAFLSGKGIEVVQTGRGGNITYHGPGQVVVYPILNLDSLGISIPELVHCLEETMILTCLDFGVTAVRSSKNHGIWVEDKKIGSIGLGIKKRICFHGIALNVTIDLTPFSWINPCGLTGVSMTSLAREMPASKELVHHPRLILDQVKKYLVRHLISMFKGTELPSILLPEKIGKALTKILNFQGHYVDCKF